jgi:hypothetical protein
VAWAIHDKANEVETRAYGEFEIGSLFDRQVAGLRPSEARMALVAVAELPLWRSVHRTSACI